jgi:hypothetical protein
LCVSFGNKGIGRPQKINKNLNIENINIKDT